MTVEEPLHEIPEDEARTLLEGAIIGLIAFVDDDGQQLLPANVQFIGDILYFRTSPDSSLARLANGHDDVAVAVSSFDTLLGTGWNVTLHGTSRQRTDEEEAAWPEQSGRRGPWAGGERDLVVAVTPTSITGRRVRHH